MNNNLAILKAFGLLVPAVDAFTQEWGMAVKHDTYDGANDYCLSWTSKNGLACSIILSDLGIPHEGLRFQAFATLPKSSGLDGFYYVGQLERLFSDYDLAEFGRLLEEARTWAEDKVLIRYSGDADDLAPIFQALKDRDPRQRYVAAIALTAVRNVAVLDPLLGALNDPDSRVHTFAIQALGSLRDSRAVEPLVKLLEHGDQGERVGAAKALGCIGDSSAVEPLITALLDRDKGVRIAVAEALGVIGDPRAVDALILKLRDTYDTPTQSVSAKALGLIGDLRALKPLQEQWMYSYQPLRSVISEAMDKINSISEETTDRLVNTRGI